MEKRKKEILIATYTPSEWSYLPFWPLSRNFLFVIPHLMRNPLLPSSPFSFCHPRPDRLYCHPRPDRGSIPFMKAMDSRFRGNDKEKSWECLFCHPEWHFSSVTPKSTSPPSPRGRLFARGVSFSFALKRKEYEMPR